MDHVIMHGMLLTRYWENCPILVGQFFEMRFWGFFGKMVYKVQYCMLCAVLKGISGKMPCIREIYLTCDRLNVYTDHCKYRGFRNPQL